MIDDLLDTYGDIDKKIFADTFLLAKFYLNNRWAPVSYEALSEMFEEAEKKASRRICDDLPQEMSALLTESQWHAICVKLDGEESEDTNGSLIQRASFLFSYFLIRMQEGYQFGYLPYDQWAKR